MPFARMIDDCFARLGVDAVYTPQAGAPVTVRVIPSRSDRIVDPFETRIQVETTVFQMRTSEVADPRAGDTIALGAEVFVVQGKPRREDPDRLIWFLDVRLQ